MAVKETKKETNVETTKKETTKKTPAKRTTKPKELKAKKVFGDVGKYLKQQGRKAWNKAKKPVAVTAAVLGVAGAVVVSHEMKKTNADLVADPEDVVIDGEFSVVNDETTEEETENTEETTE